MDTQTEQVSTPAGSQAFKLKWVFFHRNPQSKVKRALLHIFQAYSAILWHNQVNMLTTIVIQIEV